MGVVLDVVYNHLGPSGAYLDRFGPYFAGSNIWGPSLNLDGPQSDPVRRYVIDNALMWLRDFHVDGLRLDAVHALHDDRATHLLEQLADRGRVAVGAPGPPAVADRRVRPATTRGLVTPREAGGYGLHAQWCDDIHHCLHSALTGEAQGYYADFATAGLTGLAHVFTPGVPARGHLVELPAAHPRARRSTPTAPRATGSSPTCRTTTRSATGPPATGSAETLSPGLLACGAALVLSSPFTPMLFMGEEWGARTPWQFFSHFPDPGAARGRARRADARSSPSTAGVDVEVPGPATRRARSRDSKLDWAEPAQEPHADPAAGHRELIALRRAWPELSDPWLDERRRRLRRGRADGGAAPRPAAGGGQPRRRRGEHRPARPGRPDPARLRAGGGPGRRRSPCSRRRSRSSWWGERLPPVRDDQLGGVHGERPRGGQLGAGVRAQLGLAHVRPGRRVTSPEGLRDDLEPATQHPSCTPVTTVHVEPTRRYRVVQHQHVVRCGRTCVDARLPAVVAARWRDHMDHPVVQLAAQPVVRFEGQVGRAEQTGDRCGHGFLPLVPGIIVRRSPTGRGRFAEGGALPTAGRAP